MLNMMNLGHVEYVCVHAKLLQSLTLRASVSDCILMDRSPPGSSVRGFPREEY